MDIGGITPGAISAATQAQTGDAVAISVLRKALDAQQQSAMQLIEAARVTPAAAGDTLGTRIDVKV